tara:strand:- start:726 stop:866 length:141 start_codon:yes stop_codon:yes gene_type:complete
MILFSALMFACGDEEEVQEEAQEEVLEEAQEAEGVDSSAESEEPAE